MKTLFITITFLALSACSSSNHSSRYLGRLPLDSAESIFFKIYQSNELDHYTAVTCEIASEGNQVIYRERFLTGTMDYNTDLSNFYSGRHDNVAYLCYNDSNKVFALFDLSKNHGFPFNDFEYDKSYALADSLFERIRKYEPNLSAKWRE